MNRKEKTQKKITRAQLLIILCVIIGLLLLLSAIVWCLDLFMQGRDGQRSPEGTFDFDFYPVDYTENIFDDPEYVSLDNGVLFYYKDSAIEHGVIADKAEQYGDEVSFFADYIQYMIHGNVSAYNACYSDVYYENHTPKDNFTMQKLYQIKLRLYETSSVSDDNGIYTQSVYVLEYYILENNGTLRNDFLEGCRPQYITVTDREGKILIDSVETVRYQ